ncbi:nuclear receptor coactivator 2 isoform X1 [Lates japonicus]|uniref:Nuclear receptor coactivator 2 isoform X1 n=1 Tax=Lates japonicus TaxID=270547 RepID=A0AAD3MC24_LATJO|nr:nuclear receptor coactivator 2 isoform X1 [Lates japonicus]
MLQVVTGMQQQEAGQAQPLPLLWEHPDLGSKVPCRGRMGPNGAPGLTARARQMLQSPMMANGRCTQRPQGDLLCNLGLASSDGRRVSEGSDVPTCTALKDFDGLEEIDGPNHIEPDQFPRIIHDVRPKAPMYTNNLVRHPTWPKGLPSAPAKGRLPPHV